jgi:hypothetical protein
MYISFFEKYLHFFYRLGILRYIYTGLLYLYKRKLGQGTRKLGDYNTGLNV